MLYKNNRLFCSCCTSRFDLCDGGKVSKNNMAQKWLAKPELVANSFDYLSKSNMATFAVCLRRLFYFFFYYLLLVITLYNYLY